MKAAVQLRAAPFPGRPSRPRASGARRLAAMQLRKRAVRDGATAEAEAEVRWRTNLDPKTEEWRISFVLTQEECEERQAPEPGDLLQAARRRRA
jgi:hypothetical protein